MPTPLSSCRRTSTLTTMSDNESTYSDVSLDEDDEELIWRVFYSKNDEPSPEASDDELSGLSDLEDQALVAKYKALKSGDDIDDDEKKRLLITSFTDDQMERFEAYRRMAVNKPGVKKVCNSVLNHLIPQNLAVVMAGLLKLLLGDIITKAFEVQEREHKTQLIMDIEAKKTRKRETLRRLANGEDVSPVQEKSLEYLGDVKTPLQPAHIREAWRLYRAESSGTIPAKWRTQDDGAGRLFL